MRSLVQPLLPVFLMLPLVCAACEPVLVSGRARESPYPIVQDDDFPRTSPTVLSIAPAPVSGLRPPQPAGIPTVVASPTSLTLMVGEKYSLQAHVSLADGQVNGNVFWWSSDNSIASIEPSSGEVVGVSPGKVTIVASYRVDSALKALVAVTVRTDSTLSQPRQR